MNIYKILLVTLLLLTRSYVIVYAEGLTGKVVDEKGEPVGFANVILLSIPDSNFIQGTISNDEGDFVFEKVSGEEKYINVSCIGYDKLTKICTAGNLGVLSVNSSSIMLNETVISGSRPTHIMKGNSLITNIQNTLLSSVGSAQDVLKRIPGLRVDPDNSIEVFGKGTPLIYINGRKVRDVAELEQLNSEDIVNVELISNPGAEYDAEVKSVLKIRTVKPVGEGVGGYVRGSGNYSSGWGHTQQANLNWRKGGLDVFGSVRHVQMQYELDETSQLNIHGDQTWNIINNANAKGRVNNLSVETGVNYQFDDKNIAGVRYQLGRTPYYKLNFVQKMGVHAIDTPDEQLASNIDMQREQTQHHFNLYYIGKIGKKLGVDVNIDFLDGKASKNQCANEKSSAAQNDRTVTGLSDVKNRLYAAKLVFTYPIASGVLSFGGETGKTDRDDVYTNPEKLIDSSKSNTTEKKAAAFASYMVELGNLSLEGGMRYEHASFNYDELYTDKQLNRKFDNIFPSFSLSFPTGKLRHALSYTAKTRRPGYEQIDGSVQYSNRFMYKQGNPMLEPETRHDITYRTGYRFLNFSLSWVYVKNYIDMDSYLYNKDGDIMVRNVLNFDKRKELNFLLSASPKFSFWEPVGSIYVSCPSFRINYGNETMTYNKTKAVFNLNNDFTLPADFIFSLNGAYSTEGYRGITKLQSYGTIDVGLRKSFCRNSLTLNLTGSDIFHTFRSGVWKSNPWVSEYTKDVLNTRKVELTATYRFNAARSKYKGSGAANDEMRRL